MDVVKKKDLDLKIDFHTYTKSEIKGLGMQPINNHKMNYSVYEKDDKVFFFEELSMDNYRLYCVTSRKSFYLS